MSGFTLSKQPDTRAATAANVNAGANAIALANDNSNVNCNNTQSNNNESNNSNGETGHHCAEQSISTLWLDLERPSSIPDGYPLSRKSSETLPTASGPNDSRVWPWSGLSSSRAPRVEAEPDPTQKNKAKAPRLTSWLGDESRPSSSRDSEDRSTSDVESGDFRVVKGGLDERVKSFTSPDRVRMV